MKITIDTKSDTQDEIIRAIELLRTFTTDSSSIDKVNVEAKSDNLQVKSISESNLDFLNGFSSQSDSSNVAETNSSSASSDVVSSDIGVSSVSNASIEADVASEPVTSNESGSVNMDFLNMDVGQTQDNLVNNSNVNDMIRDSQVNEVVAKEDIKQIHPENQSTHINMQNHASYSDTTSFNDINKAIEMKFKRDQDQGSAPDFSSFLNLAKKAQEAKDKEKKDDVKIEFF